MSSPLGSPPERPGLGSTFKRPVSELIVGDPPNSGLSIGSTIPPEILAYYTAAPFSIDTFSPACIIMYSNPNSYHYEIVGFASSISKFWHAVGNVDLTRIGVANQVLEFSHESFIPGSVTTSTIAGMTDNSHQVLQDIGDAIGGGVGQTIIHWWNTLAKFGINGQGDLLFNEITIGRGYTAFERITAGVATDGTANEQLLYQTTNLYRFPNGRAFRVELVGRMHAAVVNRPAFNIRESNLAGAQLTGWPTVNLDVVGTEIPIYITGIFVNTSGTDVATRIAVTWKPLTANVITFDGAVAPIQTYLSITDIGDTTQYSGISV